MTRVIEFIGPQGAGKSTLAMAVIDELHRRGVTCPTQPETAAWRAKVGLSAHPDRRHWWHYLEDSTALSYPIWWAKAPVLSTLAYATALSTWPKTFSALRASKAVARWKQLFKTDVRRCGARCIVLDEGPLQYFHSVVLGGNHFSPPLFNSTIACILRTFSHRIVLVGCDSTSVMERVARRREEAVARGIKAWQFDHLSNDEQKRIIEGMITLFAQTERFIRAHYPDRIIASIDTSDLSSLDDAAQAIAPLCPGGASMRTHVNQ